MPKKLSKLLEVKQLKTHFHHAGSTIKAVDGVSFTLHRGEILGIVGESGSGKSVTARSLLRLLDVSAGSVIDGKVVYHPPLGGSPINLVEATETDLQNLRGRAIAMVFQEHATSLNPVMRCGEQLAEVLQFHQRLPAAAAHIQAMSYLKKVQLTDNQRIYNAYPHQLSGGQRQRVCIAMALCCQPAVLIADEPTTALDVTVQAEILRLLADLCRDTECAMIFISHDLGVVGELADRVGVMLNGEMVELGDTASIFTTPQHPYTKGLLACRPALHLQSNRLPTVADFAQPDTLFEPPRRVSVATDELLFAVSGVGVQFRQGARWGKSNSVKALENIDFQLFKGETLGVVGESGSGKTTLARCMAGLQMAQQGEILYRGQSVTTFTPVQQRQFRREVQLIFQDSDTALNPRLTVGAAISEPLAFHQIASDKVARHRQTLALLDAVQLPAALYHRYPRELSGGQRQRVCIARALALTPKVLICDEVVSSLDVSVQAQMLNLLRSLQQSHGLTFLFISHDLSVVRFMSDRLMVMQDGRVVEIGDAAQVYHHPKTSYTRSLLAAIPKGFSVK